MKKRLKKGFTLAELLIVVAIIAVLTAIAVPLFVTSLNKSQKAADDATISAVRSAAIAYILNQDEPTDAVTATNKGVYTGNTTTNTWELKGPWKAIGKVDSKGNVTEVTVTVATAEEAPEGKLAATSKHVIGAEAEGLRPVTVYIVSTTFN